MELVEVGVVGTEYVPSLARAHGCRVNLRVMGQLPHTGQAYWGHYKLPLSSEGSESALTMSHTVKIEMNNSLERTQGVDCRASLNFRMTVQRRLRATCMLVLNIPSQLEE